MRRNSNGVAEHRSISLKGLAEHLGLSPATVSLVVNNAPGSKTIAPKTRERVLAAAQKLNYRPNFLARSLRTRQTFTIGVIVPEFSEGYFTMVMIKDAGLCCPEDISVVGFDDIASAAYQTPSLTTIRQPLRRMGEMAAQQLLKHIQNPSEAFPDTIMFEPELMQRESTTAVAAAIAPRKHNTPSDVKPRRRERSRHDRT